MYKGSKLGVRYHLPRIYTSKCETFCIRSFLWSIEFVRTGMYGKYRARAIANTNAADYQRDITSQFWQFDEMFSSSCMYYENWYSLSIFNICSIQFYDITPFPVTSCISRNVFTAYFLSIYVRRYICFHINVLFCCCSPVSAEL